MGRVMDYEDKGHCQSIKRIVGAMERVDVIALIEYYE